MANTWKSSHHGKANNLRGNGFGNILGTCDAGKEKECSKELLNVFNQVLPNILIIDLILSYYLKSCL